MESTLAALAAQKATAAIPIVMAGCSNPVERGLVQSLARPGGNITGLTNNTGAGFNDKMLQLLKEVQAGGLLSYWTNFEEVHRQSAACVYKVLTRAKPRELPIQRPTKFDLWINLKTAKAFGLVIPRSVLLRADRVIH